MTVLDDIIAGVRLDLAARQALVSSDAVVEAAVKAGPARPVQPTLRSNELSVIAEVKRSSPSKGALAEIADPAALAAQYQAGGAAAISVLTEQRRFHGSLTDLDEVRGAVDVPVLRKDFVIEAYQLYEGRAHGADLALLIVAALTDAQIAEFLAINEQLGVTSLVEVHTPDEARRAVDLGAQVIGVNNRNLKTLAVDIQQFSRLAALIPDDRIRVAESGIETSAQVEHLISAGANAVLVGETLVKSGNPAATISDFVARSKVKR